MNSIEIAKNSRAILIPDNKNRQAAENWLAAQGFELPKLAGRCLHSQC